MKENSVIACDLLKAIAQETRLLILCSLLPGERTVSDIEQELGMRQAAVSQQLSRLRLQGIVSSRRDGKTVYYRLEDPRTEQILRTLHGIFCTEPKS
ncbi:helix-turn-helix transcriptional regulator [Halovulum dunhuangense]|uniref:Helix-turn-helix transcriptional regulator n=1 Tax=Halovulum dunhuangense TaxID=1505036 RepID=A0A849L0R6_9RHOB|nr:metalloregulator ArsR/SmtB family transcription factor [Halovulum dunhuangense]NNU79862.1 helix-turn-helix transcriptional regulator [Halovulum dunhuangense]